jgi:uncharacterized coiled-coil protein SlyX
MMKKLLGAALLLAMVASLQAQPAPRTADEPLVLKETRLAWKAKLDEVAAKEKEVRDEEAKIVPKQTEITAKATQVETEKSKQPGLTSAKANLETEKVNLDTKLIPAAQSAITAAEKMQLDENEAQNVLEAAYQDAKGKATSAVNALKKAADEQRVKTDAANRAVLTAKSDLTAKQTRLAQLPVEIAMVDTAINTQNGVVVRVTGELTTLEGQLRDISQQITKLKGEVTTLTGDAKRLYAVYYDEYRKEETYQLAKKTDDRLMKLEGKVSGLETKVDRVAKDVKEVKVVVDKIYVKVNENNEKLIKVLKDTAEIKGVMAEMKTAVVGYSGDMTKLLEKLPEGKLDKAVAIALRDELGKTEWRQDVAKDLAAKIAKDGGDVKGLETLLNGLKTDISGVVTKVDNLTTRTGTYVIVATPRYYCNNVIADITFTVTEKK